MRYGFSLIIIAGILACQPKTNKKVDTNDEAKAIEITESSFGDIEGKEVKLYTLKNKAGMEVKITNYGGIITSINVPDKAGKFDDVALGFNNLAQYLGEHPFFGAIIGRYGNRIANGKFAIDGAEYTLATNNGDNSLHGGDRGFDKHLWESKLIKGGLSLTRTSPHMEEGYPGNLSVRVDYTLTEDNAIDIFYEATTDKTTICNLTNHSYFNLAGEGNGDILNHEVKIIADQYNPVDDGLIPTGIDKVSGTPFDFTTSKKIGDDIDADHPQIKIGLGYDHNYVLNNNSGKLALAAIVTESTTGRKMEVFTTEPGVQFYCGNFLDGSIIGKRGKPYVNRGALCLETQHFPDSPNKPDFPSTILQPGETYKSQTSYKFSVLN